MTPRTLTVPFADDLLAAAADLLLSALPGAADGDLTDALVLLPSSRVCRDLQQRLLERSGRDALLLPRILTDGQWAEEMAAVMGLGDDDLPDDRVRPLLLARRLATVDWLDGGPSAAPGLAEAFVAFFDEVRRHRRDGLVLRAGDLEPLLVMAGEAEAEAVEREVARIREVWELYRRDVPADTVDRQARVTTALAEGRGPASVRPALVVVAGFGHIDPLRADLLRAALDLGQDHRVLVPAAATPLSQRFVATWGGAEAEVDPLAPTRRLVAALGGDPDGAAPDDAPLGARLAALAASGVAAPAPGPRLIEAEDPEQEAVAVAGLVAAHLQSRGLPEGGLTIATNDPGLAARITARLRDAGLDADNTVGEPLAALPSGLLLRHLLRAALTGLRAEPLLETLTHPYTRIAVGEAGAGSWALRLERMFRRETGPQAGLAALHRRAEQRDAAATALFGRQLPGMQAYVGRIVEVFAPLLAVADGRAHPFTALLDALETTWQAAAPERPLGESAQWADVTAAYRLLAALRAEAPRLGAVDLAAFTADLGRLLAAETVVPHRPQGIPIVVTGLVEARLARSGVLIAAGLNDGVFPSSSATPPVLSGRVRRRLGLPTWREPRARDAELFLRLLHAAPEVAGTWSRRRDQQPALPSALVERLLLALDRPRAERAEARPWRSEAIPHEAIARGQTAFVAEPLDVPLAAEARPLLRPSWTSLSRWRDCPYRSLLEKGFALRPDDEVRDEFGKREYGSVAHAVMCAALEGTHDFACAVVAGDAPTAEAALRAAAEPRFLEGADVLPERRLWLDTFLKVVPTIAGIEIARAQAWRTVAREAAFTFDLPRLQAWVEARAHEAGEAPPPLLPAHAVGVTFTGAIDRVDQARGAPGTLAVIDYKSGGVPTAKDITALEDMQLAVYALALALGAVAGVAGDPVEAVFYGLEEKGCGPDLPKNKPHPMARAAGEPGLLLPAARELLALAVAASDPGLPASLLPRWRTGEVSTGDLPCRWCDHRGVCRIEERDVPPAIRLGLDKVVNTKEQAR